MSGFDAFDHDEDWTEIVAGFRARFTEKGVEWTPRAAAMHLRWLLVERRLNRMKPSEFPTVRQLADAWGWKTPKGAPAVNRVSDFLSREHTVEVERGGERLEVTCLHWQDPYRVASLEWLRGDRLLGANREGSQRGANGEPTGTQRPERVNAEHPATKPTASQRAANGEPTSRASSPRASTDHLSTSPEGGSAHAVPATSQPPEPGCSPSTPTADSQPIPPSQPTSHGPLPASTGRSPTSTPSGAAATTASLPSASRPSPSSSTTTTATAAGASRSSTSDGPGPVLVDGREIPPDLPGLLSGGPGVDGRLVEGLTRAGNVMILDHLLRAGIEDTRGLLELPPERLPYQGIRDAVVNALRRFLRARWGVALGCLAAPTSDPGGPPSRAGPGPPRREDPRTATLRRLGERIASRKPPPGAPNADP